MEIAASSPAPNLKHTAALTLVIAGLVCLAALCIVWREVFLLLFAGVVLATALEPAIYLLVNRFKWRLFPAAILVYTSAAALLAGLMIWLSPLVWSQSLAVYEQLPDWYASGRQYLLDAKATPVLHHMGEWLPARMPQIGTASLAATSEGGTLDFVQSAMRYVGALIAIGMLAFYWTINRESTLRTVLLLAPEHRRPFYEELAEVLLTKVGAYVRGQLILCAIVGVMSYVAFLAIGLPYALTLAIVAGCLEAIPVFGPTLGAVPAIVVALSISPQATVIVVCVAMLIQTLENYLLVPKVMDRSVGISAVVTLLAIVVFGALFGLLGAVLAIPLAAIIQTLFQRLVLQVEFSDKEIEVGRDFAGVTRYQLLDLIHDLQRQQRHKEGVADEQAASLLHEIEMLAAALDEVVVREAATAPAVTITTTTIPLAKTA